MAQQTVLVFCLLLLFVRSGICLFVGSRDVNYTIYSMEQTAICHVHGHKETNSINNTAVIVKPNHMFYYWSPFADKLCKFVFKTNKGDGLFAVIHKMSFRRDGSECLDYVQFKRSDGHKTKKICGEFDLTNKEYYPVSDIDYTSDSDEFRSNNYNEYFEYDPLKYNSEAKLETTVFISKQRLKEGESLDLFIVYTPYKSCDRVVVPEDYRQIKYDTCILKQYFCDGIHNCVPHMCEDEANCQDKTPIISSGTGTTVTIAAVSTIFLCFIIFIMCLWICKKHKKLCWSSDCAGPNVCSTRPGALSRESEGSASPPVPSAPMLEVVVPPPVLDKDLPPSYDSLFPEQSNSTRS